MNRHTRHLGMVGKARHRRGSAVVGSAVQLQHSLQLAVVRPSAADWLPSTLGGEPSADDWGQAPPTRRPYRLAPVLKLHRENQPNIHRSTAESLFARQQCGLGCTATGTNTNSPTQCVAASASVGCSGGRRRTPEEQTLCALLQQCTAVDSPRIVLASRHSGSCMFFESCMLHVAAVA